MRRDCDRYHEDIALIGLAKVVPVRWSAVRSYDDIESVKLKHDFLQLPVNSYSKTRTYTNNRRIVQ